MLFLKLRFAEAVSLFPLSLIIFLKQLATYRTKWNRISMTLKQSVPDLTATSHSRSPAPPDE